MPPRRQLTYAEREEKNRKQREKRAQEEPEVKAKRLEEQRARAQYVHDAKKQRFEILLPAQTKEDRANEAERRREGRANEAGEVKQRRLREQAQRQQALRREENGEEKRARLQEQAHRPQALRSAETDDERVVRLMGAQFGQQALRYQETEEERMSRATVDRLRHQKRLADETREEAERLREEREEDEELLRAMNALEHAEIIPMETEEERTFREELLATRNRVGVPRTHRAACKTLTSEDRVPLHDCGEMTVTCGECNARHFKGERPSDNKFTQCCAKGKVILPPPKECPQPLAKLLQNENPKAKAFMMKIRNYNSAHALASLGAKISSSPGRGPYCFRIHGQVYHNTTLVGLNTNNPRYADLYFIDAAQASEFRAHSTSNGGCCRNLMEELDAMLREKNPYAA
ncbi:Uncharacterized protein APZ42_001095, partial [Daphnia magna]